MKSEHNSPLSIPCPDETLGETAQDCPWSGLARRWIAEQANSKTISAQLREQLPKLQLQLRADARFASFKSAWGTSLNYDEFAKGIIVEPAILQSLYSLTSVTRPTGTSDAQPTDPKHPSSDDAAGVQHAGIEHTYGYLFSVLKTSFGYKRARWVQGEIEKGFGLPEGILGPDTSDGSLFRKVTYFAGRIGFRNDRRELSLLERDKESVAKALTSFDYSRLSPRRLEETVELHSEEDTESRTVVLRTDLIPFLNPPKTGQPEGANSHLLVYSIAESATRARLITAFPVNAKFVDGIFKAEDLGEGKPVTTRYNAFVPGLTGQKIPGKRIAKNSAAPSDTK